MPPHGSNAPDEARSSEGLILSEDRRLECASAVGTSPTSQRRRADARDETPTNTLSPRIGARCAET